MTFRRTAVFAAATLLAPFAHALVIDFDASPSALFLSTASSHGFTVSAQNPMYLGTRKVFDGEDFGNGTNFLVAWNNDGIASTVFKLQQTNLQAFSLNSFQFSNTYSMELERTSSIDVTGYRLDGTTETQTFGGVGSLLGLTTFQLNASFVDLSYVTFSAHGTASTRAMFDNITVDEAVAAVPEPGSFALLGLGLAGLALHRKRQQA